MSGPWRDRSVQIIELQLYISDCIQSQGEEHTVGKRVLLLHQIRVVHRKAEWDPVTGLASRIQFVDRGHTKSMPSL